MQNLRCKDVLIVQNKSYFFSGLKNDANTMEKIYKLRKEIKQAVGMKYGHNGHTDTTDILTQMDFFNTKTVILGAKIQSSNWWQNYSDYHHANLL